MVSFYSTKQVKPAYNLDSFCFFKSDRHSSDQKLKKDFSNYCTEELVAKLGNYKINRSRLLDWNTDAPAHHNHSFGATPFQNRHLQNLLSGEGYVHNNFNLGSSMFSLNHEKSEDNRPLSKAEEGKIK